MSTIYHGRYIIRVLKRKRRAKFTPEGTQCPVPTDQLDSWRKTTVRRTGEDEKHSFDNYPDVTKKEKNELVPGLVKLPSDKVCTYSISSSLTTTCCRIGCSHEEVQRQDYSNSNSKVPTTNGTTSYRTRSSSTTSTTRSSTWRLDWEHTGERWIRHHVLPRTRMFVPTDGPGDPPLHSLEPYRITIATDTTTDEVHQIRGLRWRCAIRTTRTRC